MYKVIFSKNAKRQLKKLEKEIQKRIVFSLEKIRIRPHYFVKRIIGTSLFRLRVGDYRILIDIDNKTLIIEAVKISHRKNIYQ